VKWSDTVGEEPEPAEQDVHKYSSQFRNDINRNTGEVNEPWSSD